MGTLQTSSLRTMTPKSPLVRCSSHHWPSLCLSFSIELFGTVAVTHCPGSLSPSSMAVILGTASSSNPPVMPILPPKGSAPSLHPYFPCSGVAPSDSCLGDRVCLPLAPPASRRVSLTAAPHRHQRELKAFGRRGSTPGPGPLSALAGLALPQALHPPGRPSPLLCRKVYHS